MAKTKRPAKAKATPVDVRESRRRNFVRALADFLTKNQAFKSVRVEAGDPEALAWRELRLASPLFGYPTVDEAEQELLEFFELTPAKERP